MIPKIVHYCWFGHNDKPELIKKCISSWYQFLPDWEFCEWNEENYNVYKNSYIEAAYKKKKWAFVSDYARFDILNQFGGVYLDTDVELLKPIPKDLMEQQAFTGFQSNNRVAPGLIYGSEAKQHGLQRMLDIYERWNFVIVEGVKPMNILDAFIEAFLPLGLKLDGKYQVIDGIAIYPKEMFCCYDFETLTFDVTPDTVSVHHYYASWMPQKQKIRQACIKVMVKVLGKRNFLKFKHYFSRG